MHVAFRRVYRKTSPAAIKRFVFTYQDLRKLGKYQTFRRKEW